MPAGWSPTAVRLVRGWQERLYGAIGEQLGLGYAPGQAFDRLARPRIPREILSFDRFGRFLGPQQLPSGAAAHFETVVDEYMTGYAALTPPTRYEDVNFFAVFNELLDTVRSAAADVGFRVARPVLIATLPIGEVHADTRLVGSDGEIIILFQHGLASFLHRWAMCIGTALPYEIDDPGPSAILRLLPPAAGRFNAAADQVTNALFDYVARGNARSGRNPDLDQSAMMSSVLLLRPIELFLVAHEYMHAYLGHLVKGRASLPPAVLRQQENDSDDTGASLTVRIMGRGGVPAELSLWATDLALVSLDFVMKSVQILSTGRVYGDADTLASHPAIEQRRQYIRETLSRNLSEAGKSDDWERASQLLQISQAIVCEDLWDVVQSALTELHRQGYRASPVWSQTPAISHRRMNVSEPGGHGGELGS